MSKHDIETVPFELDEEEPAGKPLHVRAGQLLAKLGLLWSHRRWIGLTTFASMVITVAMAFLLPNQYTASVYLNPPDSNPVSGINLLIGMKGGGVNLGSQVNDMLGLQSPGQLYLRQLQTRTVEDRIIDRFNLQKVYGAKQRYTARRALEGSTRMDEDRKSGVIGISVTNRDPKLAAQIANAYAEELGQLIADVNAVAGRREREYFEAQLEEARNKLDQAQKQLGEFASKSGTMDVTGEGQLLVGGIAAIEGQLIASQAELKGLLEIYTDKHERVQQVRAKIAELNRQLQQMKGKTTGSGSAGSAASDDLHPTVKNVWGLTVPYLDYYRRVKVQEAVVDTLTQQYQIAKFRETYRVGDVQVIDPADVPERKSSPHRATMGAMAGLMVFLFCCGYVLVTDWWATTDSADPWKQLLQPAVTKLADRRDRARLWFTPVTARWRRGAQNPEPAPQDE